MNIQQMMKQAQRMQEQMQKQMAETTVEGSAGGGMVNISMNGMKQLLSVKIEPDAVSSGDVEMLQDLILAAFNEAARKVDEQLSSQLGGMTGGMKIPGLF
jgi:DNA-binding YbaB/EbfC family protein